VLCVCACVVCVCVCCVCVRVLCVCACVVCVCSSRETHPKFVLAPKGCVSWQIYISNLSTLCRAHFFVCVRQSVDKKCARHITILENTASRTYESTLQINRVTQKKIKLVNTLSRTFHFFWSDTVYLKCGFICSGGCIL